MKGVEKEKTSQAAGATSEDMTSSELRMRLSEIELKLESLLLADKYHRILHAVYIFLLLILIITR